jgi:hypothetical protein
MSFKRKRVIIIVIAGIILSVWGWCVYDINKRLPQAEYMEYTASEPACINGLTIIPVGNRIYTMAEFKSAYPENDHYDEWKQTENVRIVVYELELENTISDDIWFSTVSMEAFETESCWGNGIGVIDESKNTIIISPGQKETVSVTAYIGDGSMTKKQLNGLKCENMGLALSYYPENIVLRFTGAL